MSENSNNHDRNQRQSAERQSEASVETGEALYGETESDRAVALEAEIAQLKDQSLRALAEGENLRRRLEREKEDVGRFAVSAFARDLLPVADNLRRALQSVTAEVAGTTGIDTLLTGIEATERELLASLARHGVMVIEPVGQSFDPNFHQAMFEIADSGQEPGTVVQQLQAGYIIHGRLLRPALVGVAKGPAARADAAADTEPQRPETTARTDKRV